MSERPHPSVVFNAADDLLTVLDGHRQCLDVADAADRLEAALVAVGVRPATDEVVRKLAESLVAS